MTVVLAAMVTLTAYGGRPLCVAAVLVVQLVMVLAWPRAFGAPARAQTIAVAAAATLVADGALLARVGTEPLAPVTAVLGFLVLAAVVAQLARRDDRHELVAALTAAVTVAVLAVQGSFHVAILDGRSGAAALVLTVTGAAAGAVAALVPAPVPARLVAGVLVGAAVAAIAVSVGVPLPGGDRIAWLAAATVGAAGGFSGALGSFVGSVRGGDAIGRRAVQAVLPLLLAAPPGYVLARVLLG